MLFFTYWISKDKEFRIHSTVNYIVQEFSYYQVKLNSCNLSGLIYQNLKCALPFDIEIPFLDVCPTGTFVCACKDLGNRIFIAAIFAIAKY